MRLTEVDTLLLEHNIINIPDLEAWVEDIANKCSFQEGVEWCRAKFRKYLINADKTSNRISGLSPNAPDWMVKRFEEGVPLHRFNSDHTVGTYLEHIVDFLNSLAFYANHEELQNDPLNRAAKQFLPKLPKLSVEQAHDQAEKWFATLNKSVLVTGDGDGKIEVVLRTEVGTWVELLDAEATKYEGSKMGHCVGGGSYTVGNGGRYRIFSLRDGKNEPHVTVSLHQHNNSVEQVKGKQNQAPIAKYEPAVTELLNTINATASSTNHDLSRMGVYYGNGKFGSIADVGEKIDEIDGVSIIKYNTGSGGYFASNPDNNWYYVFRRHVYAKFQIKADAYGADKEPRLQGLSFTDAKNQGVKDAVWKIIAQFLNKQHPVPAPGGTVSSQADTILYRNGEYGLSRQQMSEEVGFLDGGYRVMKLDVWNMKTVDIYDHEDKHVLALEERAKNHYATTSSYCIIADPVEGVQPPSPKTIISAIMLADMRGVPHLSLRNLGVWTYAEHSKHLPSDWAPGQPDLMAFDPAARGMIKIADDVWGGEKEMKTDSPDIGYLYTDSGFRIAEVHYMNYKSSINSLIDDFYMPPQQEGAEPRTHAQLKTELNNKLRQNSGNLAAWFNHINMEAPTRPYQREQLRPYGLVRKAGKWVAVADAEPAHSENGFTLQAVNKSITVRDPEGKLVLTASKGREKYAGVEITKIGGTTKTQQGAIIALDKFLAKSGWEVSHDWDIFGRAMVVKVGERMSLANEVHPPRDIMAYPDGAKWQEAFLEYFDPHYAKGRNGYWAHPMAGKYTLRDADGVIRARLYCDEKQIKLISIRNDEKKNYQLANSDTVIAIMPAVTDLIEKESLEIDRTYFGKTLNLSFKDGKLIPLSDDARLEEFLKGRINYEDGHYWEKYGWESKDYNWTLQNGKETLIKVMLGSHGIEKVFINKKEHHRDPKAYMGFMLDLIELSVGSVEEK